MDYFPPSLLSQLISLAPAKEKELDPGGAWGGLSFVSDFFFVLLVFYFGTIMYTCTTITWFEMKFTLGKIVQINGG